MNRNLLHRTINWQCSPPTSEPNSVYRTEILVIYCYLTSLKISQLMMKCHFTMGMRTYNLWVTGCYSNPSRGLQADFFKYNVYWFKEPFILYLSFSKILRSKNIQQCWYTNIERLRKSLGCVTSLLTKIRNFITILHIVRLRDNTICMRDMFQ